ncbi:MAG: signal recognition particle-docking protein FtsY, partial [Nanoarchaeota archaeon]
KKEVVHQIQQEPQEKKAQRKEKINGIKITYFVHGTTTDNEQGLCTGWNQGELSELGKKQSKELLNLIGDVQFDVIFCSDLKRAVDSARLTFVHDPYKIIQDKRLRECNYGNLNGKEEAMVKKEIAQRVYTPFPQGESYHDVEARMAEFLNDIWRSQYGKHIAIVAHQGPQLALDVLLKRKTWEQAMQEDWRQTKQWQPGWMYVMDKEVTVSTPVTISTPPVEEKKSFFGKIKESIFKKEISAEESIKETKAEPVQASPIEEKSFLGKVKETLTTKMISAEKFEELFWDLELALLENNVSVEVIDKIKEDLKTELVNKPLPQNVPEKIQETLKQTLQEILSIQTINVLERVHSKKPKPFVIAFFGINGTGKTTTIAKLTHYLQQHKKSVVLAACDTFRAAAIQQLEEHGEKLGVKVIAQNYGSDAAAVAYDAIKYAEKNALDVVMIDTAGRLHSNTNLMAELEKIIRVTKPDLKLFVGESITGNDCIEQARRFNQLVEMDGAILTKADVDEKGGAPLSISYTIKKPILFLGVGQRYEDLEEFNPDVIMKRLGL